MKHMKYLWAFLVLAVAGCSTIHEYPGDDPADPTGITLTLNLNVDFSLISDPMPVSYATKLSGDYDVRYIVDLVARSGQQRGERVRRIVETDDELSTGKHTMSLTVPLHAEQYAVRAWVDFVEKGTESDLYYKTDDLCAVEIREPYAGCEEMRDAFAGTAEVDLRPYREAYFAQAEADVELVRPFGKYRLVSTDVQKFIETYVPRLPDGTYAPDAADDVLPATVKIGYPNYFPFAYNVETGFAAADRFVTGTAFTEKVVEITEAEAVLAFDYVFICAEETVVFADLEIYDRSGKRISGAANIRIPLQRNRLTTVSGEFLTVDYGGGGIGVDDRFDDEIVIVIPD